MRLTLRRAMILVVGFALIFFGMRLWPQNPFRPYPRSPALDEHSWWQSHSTGRFGHPSIVKLTTFPTGSPKVAVLFEVDVSGKARQMDEVYAWATQGGGSKQLSRERMNDLRTAIRALPPSDSPPPLKNLLVVGFKPGLGWTTRVYDRSKLPPVVLQLCEIVGFKDAIGK